MEYCCKLYQELCEVAMGVHIEPNGTLIDIYWCDAEGSKDLSHLQFKFCPYCQKEFDKVAMHNNNDGMA